MPQSRRIIGTEDSAVSPVIGTILMVAITVLLAAGVVVMVNVLSTPPEFEPDLVLYQSGTGNATVFTVAAAPSPPMDWSVFTNSTYGAANCSAVLPTGTVDAGDQITFAGSSGNCVGALYTLTDTARNRVAFQDNL